MDGLSGESGEGNGFKLGEAEIESSNLKRTVTNCIAAYNQLSGFTTNDNHADVVAHMNIYNNISYKNGGVEHAGYGFYILDPDGTSETDERERRIFKNNISYLKFHTGIDFLDINFDYIFTICL